MDKLLRPWHRLFGHGQLVRIWDRCPKCGVYGDDVTKEDAEHALDGSVQEPECPSLHGREGTGSGL